MTRPRPHSLTDEQLRTLMTVTRALAPRHRCSILTAVLAEMAYTADVQQAIHTALERLQRKRVSA